MNPRHPHLPFAAALLALGLVLAPLARAADMTVSPKTYKRLEQAFALIAVEKFQGAREILDSLDGKKSLNPHEQALVHQTLGYVESSLGRYKQAAARFEKCLAIEALPGAAQLATRYDLAQMYLATEDYPKAARTLESWFAKADNPGAAAYQLLATAYVQQGQFKKALEPAKQAVAKSPQPNEGRLQLLVSIHLELADYRRATPLVEQLVDRFPRPAYWRQLAGLYVELERPKDALAVMQLAQAQGALESGRELETLAQLYLFNGIPYRAAEVVEAGIASKAITPKAKTWELLGDAWMAAQEFERAVTPLETAARLSGDGKILIRLAQAHIAREDWKRAGVALERALATDKLAERGEAWVLLGISRSSADDVPGARRAFAEAGKFAKTKHQAAQWLKHLEVEEARRSELD